MEWESEEERERERVRERERESERVRESGRERDVDGRWAIRMEVPHPPSRPPAVIRFSALLSGLTLEQNVGERSMSG
jgi:hypothetical protein